MSLSRGPADPAANPVQRRLVQTMVSQAALALEHVRLVRAETQARIPAQLEGYPVRVEFIGTVKAQ